MQNLNKETLLAGPKKGKLKPEIVMGISVFELAELYPEFFESVFNVEIDFLGSMIMIADSRRYLPIFIPARFMCSLKEPRGGTNDSFAHAYIALTLAIKEPLLCELEKIDTIPRKNKLLTAREGFIFFNFFKWLTGEELNPKHILLTSSFYQGGERAGVYFDDCDGCAKISPLEHLVSSGYQICYRFEKAGEK